MADIDWHLIVSTLAGGSVVGAIAKWAVGRSLEQLDKMVDALHAIEMRLAAMDVHVHEWSKFRELVLSHDREIGAMKAHLDLLGDPSDGH